jgi:hypothetical protein
LKQRWYTVNHVRARDDGCLRGHTDGCRLHPCQVDAAKAGNVEHIIALLRDVGRLHHLWQVTAYSRGHLVCSTRPAPDVG